MFSSDLVTQKAIDHKTCSDKQEPDYMEFTSDLLPLNLPDFLHKSSEENVESETFEAPDLSLSLENKALMHEKNTATNQS